jgi:hypothetical protein
VAGAGEADTWAVGEESAALGAWTDETNGGGGDRPASGGSLLKGGDRGQQRGGIQQRGCHAALGRTWGLAPTGGRRPDRVSAAARLCFDSGALTRLTRGPGWRWERE